MADQAQVTSLEALERFRAVLIRYQERAAVSIHEISEEVSRTRHWVHNDRLVHWKMEIRRMTRELNDAQQRLFSAEISEFRETVSEEKRDMMRAREKLKESENKLRVTKKWNQNFDSTVGPMAKQVERLRTVVDDELPKAIHQITEMIKSLETYGERMAKPSEAPPQGAPETESAAPASPPPPPEEGE